MMFVHICNDGIGQIVSHRLTVPDPVPDVAGRDIQIRRIQFQEFPMEYSVELRRLIDLEMEDSIG